VLGKKQQEKIICEIKDTASVSRWENRSISGFKIIKFARKNNVNFEFKNLNNGNLTPLVMHFKTV
jgi:hypothetical protein